VEAIAEQMADKALDSLERMLVEEVGSCVEQEEVGQAPVLNAFARIAAAEPAMAAVVAVVVADFAQDQKE